MAFEFWKWLAWSLVAFVAAAHFLFMAAEMFAWAKIARRVAGLTDPVAEATKAIGANQGLYNGFLAAGLTWSLAWSAAPALDRPLALFFVICVLIAGIFGAFTIQRVNLSLLGVQALPALLALLALCKSG
jgi:putative membrane protein